MFVISNDRFDTRVPVRVWLSSEEKIEEGCLKQAVHLAKLPFVHRWVSLMPDTHMGMGMPIGGVIAAKGTIIPNAVGSDIGCGMIFVPMNVQLAQIQGIMTGNGSLIQLLVGDILRNIPTGINRYKMPQESAVLDRAKEQMELYEQNPELTGLIGDGYYQTGTLGGGNHFIELDKDDEGNVYLVIHTGSRNLGKQVADIYQNRAIKHLTEGADEFEETIKRTIEEYKAAGRRSELQSVIKQMRKSQQDAEPMLPRDLCYVENDAREDYLHDMRICQRWAVLNRKLISLLLLKFFPNVNIVEEFESIHNYISNNNIIRKGSISAAEGERCIIPLNMRDGSLLCTGKGNPDWNCSAPHGAGRVLSRTKAYEKISMEDFEASMQGIYSESVNDFTRDESPMVYKPADEIIANIGDTVSIDTIIRPIFNFKAS